MVHSNKRQKVSHFSQPSRSIHPKTSAASLQERSNLIPKPITDSLAKIKQSIDLRLPKPIWNRIKGYRKQWDVDHSTTHQQVYFHDGFSLCSSLRHLPKNVQRSPEEYILLKKECKAVDAKNTLWYDREGRKIVQYLSPFIPLDLATELEEQLQQLIEVSFFNYHFSYATQASKPHPPKDQKYRHHNYDKCKAALPTGTPCGVLQLNIQHQRGHFHDAPGPSADSAGKCYRTEAATRFRTSSCVTRLSTLLSIALAAIDHDTW